ncbi:MAG: metal-dependent transcriptional regulator [Promethearchaeota archaeon]
MDEKNKVIIIIRRRDEDYLKTIYKIARTKKNGGVSNSEISSCLNVKPSSITSILYKLKEKGLIIWNSRKLVKITKEGKDLAEYLFNNFNILKLFFLKILKFKDSKKIDEICCKLEHFFDPITISAFIQFVLNYK